MLDYQDIVSVPYRGSMSFYTSNVYSPRNRRSFRPLSGFYEFLSYSPDRFHCNAVPLDLRRKRKTPQIHEKTSF